MPDFDPDKYLSSPESEEEFNPDKYLGVKPREKMSPADAAVAKFGQGLTLGYMDELAGGIEAGIDKAIEPLFPEVEKKPFIERYRENRDIHRQRSAKAEEDQPEVSLVSDLAGSATSMLSPAGLASVPAKGARFVPALAKTAAGGAVVGFGGSDTDVTKGPDQAQEALKDAAIGGAFAGGVQSLGKPLSYVAGKLSPEALRSAANERAVKSAIGQNKKAFKELTKTGQLQKTGADLLAADEFGGPAVGWFSKAEDILPKTVAKKEAVGKAIGEVGKKIDDLAPNSVDGSSIAAKLEKILGDIPDTPKNSSVRDALSKEIKYYANKGPMSFAEAQKLKGTYTFKPTDSTTQVLGQDVTNAARRAVSEEMDLAASRVASDPSISPKTKEQMQLYEMLKAKYGSMATAVKSGEERVLSNLSNRFVSPSDYAAGSTAGLASVLSGGFSPTSAAMAAGGAAANKFVRERGNAFAARSLDKLSRIMESNPAGLNRFRGAIESAASRGPQALMLTHIMLSKDPEYQQLIESQP